MRLRLVFNLLFVLCLTAARGMQPYVSYDRPAFYAAMASSNIEEIDAQIAQVKNSTLTEKEAFEGALLMKKSGLVKKPAEKLRLFKNGRSKLEASIARDKENTEYRFLRLIIQEHAPNIVKYRGELENDSQFIRSNFKNLPPVVQQAIIDYTKKSGVLKPSYF